jgi:hypothetical protein
MLKILVFVASIVVEVFQVEPMWKWLWLRERFLCRERFASARLLTSSPTIGGISARCGKGLNETNVRYLGKVFQTLDRDQAYDHLPGCGLESYLQALFFKEFQ